MFGLHPILTVVLVLGGLALLAWWLNPGAFGRAKYAAKAQVGKRGDQALAADPVAVFRQKVRDTRARTKTAVSAWDANTALVSRLTRQVADEETEVRQLTNRLQQDPNGTKAEEYAKRLAKVRKQLSSNREQLALVVAQDQELKSMVQQMRSEAASLEQEQESLASRLEFSEQFAAIRSSTAGLTAEEDGPSVAEARNLLQGTIDKNMARGQHAEELGGSFADSESDLSLEAQSVLDEFRKPQQSAT